MYMYKYIYIYMYICKYVYIYLYIYIFMYIYIFLTNYIFPWEKVIFDKTQNYFNASTFSLLLFHNAHYM